MTEALPPSAASSRIAFVLSNLGHPTIAIPQSFSQKSKTHSEMSIHASYHRPQGKQLWLYTCYLEGMLFSSFSILGRHLTRDVADKQFHVDFAYESLLP